MTFNVNDLKTSKFLTKHDVEPAILVTIERDELVNVALETQAPEEKYVLYFKELEKPLVLNMTNGQLIAAIIGSENSGDWAGKQVVLYNDKTVMYAGKLTGGIRVRAVQQPVQQAATAPVEDTTDHGDIPF